jgi:hypothetical protein
MELTSDQHDMRNKILADIIDKMHERMADKMFPPESHGDNEMADAKGEAPKMAMGGLVPSEVAETYPTQAEKGDRLSANATGPTGTTPANPDVADSQDEDDAMLMEELMKQYGK